MKYYEYEVDKAFLNADGDIVWKITGSGSFIIGIKGSDRFFIKRRFDPIFPDKSLPKATKDFLMNQIIPVVNKQKNLQSRMSSFDTFKDHIAVELKLIEGDMDNRLVTITYQIPGGLDDTYNYPSISRIDFVKLAKDMATILSKIHKTGVIHGDLKPKNFVFTKEGGSYTAYLIDFDISYSEDDIPDILPGSAGYFSPEAIIINDKCEEILNDTGDEEDLKKIDRSMVSNKVDVFTLALVYHVLWTGVFPTFDVKYDSVGSALNGGSDITISSKFNFKIGEGCKATFKSLLNWMIAKDPTKRPTMDEVLDVLDDKSRVPSEFHIGDDELNIKPYLWQDDILITESFDVKYLEGKNVEEFYPSTKTEGEKTVKVYTVKLKGDPNFYNLTIDELFEKGILTRVEAKYDEPFEEDNAEFISKEELQKLGINKIERFKEEYTGRNRYRITQRSIIFTKSIRSLIQMGIAKDKPITSNVDPALFDEPYSADLTYNDSRLIDSKIVSIKRSATEGNYIVKWADRGEHELSENVVISMGFLVRKV